MDTGATIPALIRRHRVTHLQCTPSMARMLMLDPIAKETLGGLRKLMIGGEAFSPLLAKDLKDTVRGDILNMYGPTETTVWSSTHIVEGMEDTISIGRPIANTTFYVLDKHLQPVPVGIPGELFIAGKGVARGYLNRPELTSERFVKDPFSHIPGARMYRTGDLACYRPDGNLEFLGRIDNQVKIRGHRVELGEIEAVLSRHPHLREVAVVAKADRWGGTQLAAYGVPVKGQKPTVESLRSFLLERLPEYMVPSVYVNLEALPLTPNKKLDRAALPEPDQARPILEGSFVAARTYVEQQLARIWTEVLNVKAIGVNDNFFDLGGHSLSAVQVAFRVRQLFGIDFPLRMLFQAPRLADLAGKVEGMLVEQADTTQLGKLIEEIEQMSAEELASSIRSMSASNDPGLSLKGEKNA
jgi:acyl carrier protein